MQRLHVYLLVKHRQSERQKPCQSRQRWLTGLARLVLSLFALAVCGVLLAGGVVYASLTHDLPSLDQLPVLLNRQNGELLQPTRLLDRSGSTTLAKLENAGISRRFLSADPTQPDHFSPQLLQLTVATLDPTFWTNNGVSSLTSSSASPATIAERLVRSLLLANESDSLRTTLRLKLLAAEVIYRYGRTQTLEWYLNSVYFGHLSYGADSAAQLYLQKSAADLDLAQSALLVSLIQSPALNPLDAPTAALEDQQKLLTTLAQSGAISATDYAAAAAEKLQFATLPASTSSAAAFLRMVESQLQAELGQDRVERGGLVVTTSLDVDLQQQLTCTAHSQLQQIESSTFSNSADCPAANLLPTQNFTWKGGTDLSAGGLILDPQTGQVLAYAVPASIDGTAISLNYQIGSLASPFVALAAFARGTSPASLEWDVPSALPVDLADQTNPDGTFHGPVNVRLSLANDYVVPFATLMEQIDPQTVWSLASATGLSSPRQQSASAALLFGGGQSSLLEVAQAYAVFAASGNQNGAINASTGQIEPVFVLKVQSASGQMLIDHSQPQSQPVLSRSLTYLLNNVLSDENARWTSLGHPNALEIGRTVAVKTGQIASKSQVWTVGYTPNQLVLTWIGEQENTAKTAPLDMHMSAGFWHALMQYSTQSLTASAWDQPSDVSTIQVCSPSGLLPTAICPNVTSDVFLNGNEPTQTDTLYEDVKVNRETGLLATVFTPAELIQDQVYLNVPANLREWATSAGLQVPPLGYDAISTTSSNPLVQITSPSLFAPVSGKVTIRGTATVANLSSYSVQIGQGINPQDWQQVGTTGTTPITEGTLAIWDTSSLDGLYAVRLNVVSQDNQIQTAVIQVTVDNTPPTIRIISPTHNSQITSHGSVITLSADVTDAVGVANVEWWLDGKKLGERTQLPYTYLWSPTLGQHTLQIKATDTAGNTSVSDTIEFTVQP